MIRMLMLSTCIYNAISAPANTKENTYILATVLFYKDAKGQIMIASGPVPQLTDYAIRDDITSRIDSAAVKIVPIFNETNGIPQSLDVLDYVKDEYETVFVAEIPQRLSRNFVADLWNYYSRGVLSSRQESKRHLVTISNKNAKQSTKTTKRLINRVKQPIGFKEITMIIYDDSKSINSGKATIDTGNNIGDNDGGKCETCKNSDENIPPEAQDKDVDKTIEVKEDAYEPKVLSSADEFIPNDIYYGIEKKCVNWSDGCNQQSKNILHESSNHFNYVYKRPRIVQWVP